MFFLSKTKVFFYEFQFQELFIFDFRAMIKSQCSHNFFFREERLLKKKLSCIPKGYREVIL